MRAALAFVLGLLAVFAPSLEARRLLQSSGVTDADILNFALNLEVSVVCTAAVTAAVHLRFSPAAAAVSYLASQQALNHCFLVLQCLEAQYYSCAVFGTPLSDGLTGKGPQPIGCQQANFTNDDIYSIAMDVANNEIAHVNYLRTALGNYSVQCPLVNIGDAFSAAADAALNTTLSPPFVPYTNDLYFLTGAFIFEDLGVTAYKGALTSFQSSDIMLAAAGEHLQVAALSANILLPNVEQCLPAV